MASSVVAAAKSVIVGLWRALDFTRRALLNALVGLLLLALLWAVLRPSAPPLSPRTTLVLDLKGPLREQFAGNPRDQLLRRAQGQELGQTRLRDVLQTLEAAAREPAIDRVLLLTDSFAGAGPATLHEVAAALKRVRAAGKTVWAWSNGYTQPAYYLAAQADKVLLHPMGEVDLHGYGGYRTYWGTAFERYGVTPHVLRAGAYKNAGETWTASGPSPETLEADRTVYDALWALYTGGVETARKLPAGSVDALIRDLPARLTAVGGDGAALARQAGLVDELMTADQLRAALMAGGGADADAKTFRQVAMGGLLARLRPPHTDALIGVVVAEGGIRDGQAPPGAVGGESTAQLIRRAREEDRVKAVVLRVDSPGGSAFASEQIRRELELTREAGKPVVVSMGDVAASGGYWISMAADEVIADPATITGSIGVIAMFPGFDKAFNELGLRSGGYATTWLAGATDPRRPLDPRLAQVIQAGIDHTYAEFTGKAAAARGLTREAVDAVAQGRIWTGAQAQQRQLLDRTGGFGDALASAAKRAGLSAGAWRPAYIEVEPGRLDRLLMMVGPELRALVAAAWPGPTLGQAVGAVVQDDLADLQGLLEPGARGRAQAHCLCGAP